MQVGFGLCTGTGVCTPFSTLAIMSHLRAQTKTVAFATRLDTSRAKLRDHHSSPYFEDIQVPRTALLSCLDPCTWVHGTCSQCVLSL